MKLYLRDDMAALWRGRDPFEEVARLNGDVFRHREGRRTLRVALGDSTFFLKEHRGVGWPEILKNLSQAKKPVVGAEQEYRAILRTRSAGIDTLEVAAFGSRGINPARRHSFLLTDELTGTVSLEDVVERWRERPGSPRYKQALIRRVADIARRLHDAGVNHRDFYLCHFLVSSDAMAREDAGAPLHLIDLHRSQVRRRVPRRWRVKDLAGLYFSLARLDPSLSDLMRFVVVYEQRPLREALRANGKFWQAVRRDAEHIYRRYYEVEPVFPLRFCEHPGKDI